MASNSEVLMSLREKKPILFHLGQRLSWDLLRVVAYSRQGSVVKDYKFDFIRTVEFTKHDGSKV